VHEETLDDGDLLIMTTDGVHDAVDEHELAGLAFGAAPEDLAPRLVETALRRGSHDNCTAVVAHYVESAARRR
jgi:serine/threonine protein phosphatase PrpC